MNGNDTEEFDNWRVKKSFPKGSVNGNKSHVLYVSPRMGNAKTVKTNERKYERGNLSWQPSGLRATRTATFAG